MPATRTCPPTLKEAQSNRNSSCRHLQVCSLVHGGVERVEKLVPEFVIIDEIELPPGVVVGVVVAGARKVQPFRMAYHKVEHDNIRSKGNVDQPHRTRCR